ncbi:UNKNOWN [Stylonychia lemnae]|uniref:Uncharacterized protein n=1 Tax=Stylonychia lemnae TaxID=5949 RepID=A0A078B794_STYLE|nr:UNKNOWN [Stylonychia lemnae]|eukprot:CDW90071.1 UNKNOWN [Stylonychia lemnae]
MNRNNYLNDKSLMDKFIIVNRFKNLAEVTDMNFLRSVAFRIQDMFTQMNNFLLESYKLPGSYQDFQRRLLKEKISSNEQQSQKKALEQSKRNLNISNLESIIEGANGAQFNWILIKEKANNEEETKGININTDLINDITKIYEYLPCTVKRQLKTPLLYNKCKVRFQHGNQQMGFKTKFRMEYRRFQDILAQKGWKKKKFMVNGMVKDQVYDDIWNKMCQRIITLVIIMKPEIQHVQDRTIQLMEFKFEIDDQLNPWLCKIKTDLNFKLKGNMFDDYKANILNEVMNIAEFKISQYRSKLKKHPLMFNHNEINQKQARVTLKQLENSQIYKKKSIKVKDVIQIAKLEESPQAFYIYKNRNDILINKLRRREDDTFLFKDHSADRAGSQMTDAQKYKIKQHLAKTKNRLQFHVNQQFLDQLIEDIQRILNNNTSENMLEDMFLIKKIDHELVSVGFRIMYLNYHREDIQVFINSYTTLKAIAQKDHQWMENKLLEILSGETNPKAFMHLVKDKLKEIEKQTEQLRIQIGNGKNKFFVNSQKVKNILQGKIQDYLQDKITIESNSLNRSAIKYIEQTPQSSRTILNASIQESSFISYTEKKTNKNLPFSDIKLNKVISEFFGNSDQKQTKKDIEVTKDHFGFGSEDDKNIQMYRESSSEDSISSITDSLGPAGFGRKNGLRLRRISNLERRKERLQIAKEKFERVIKQDGRRLSNLESFLNIPASSRTFYDKQVVIKLDKVEDQINKVNQGKDSIVKNGESEIVNEKYKKMIENIKSMDKSSLQNRRFTKSQLDLDKYQVALIRKNQDEENERKELVKFRKSILTSRLSQFQLKAIEKKLIQQKQEQRGDQMMTQKCNQREPNTDLTESNLDKFAKSRNTSILLSRSEIKHNLKTPRPIIVYHDDQSSQSKLPKLNIKLNLNNNTTIMSQQLLQLPNIDSRTPQPRQKEVSFTERVLQTQRISQNRSIIDLKNDFDGNESNEDEINKLKFRFKLLFPFNETCKRDFQDELATLKENDNFTLAMIIKKAYGMFKCHNFKR